MQRNKNNNNVFFHGATKILRQMFLSVLLLLEIIDCVDDADAHETF